MTTCEPLPRKNVMLHCYRLKNLLQSEIKICVNQRRLFRRTVREHLCEHHKLEDAEEIRDGRIWWAWWLQIESTKNHVRINHLMKEYPNSMVTKPLLIEFSISYRTVWAHPIQANDALTADTNSTLIEMVGRSRRNQERTKVVDLMAPDPVV